MVMCVCRRNTVRESSHISFFCGGDSFLWSSATAGEHTQGADSSALVTSGSLPSAWVTSGSLPSVQNYRPYIVFSSPMRKYEHPLRFTYFLLMAGHWNLQTSVFFSVICWSYLRTEISVLLSIVDKLYSSSSSFIFSTLLMLYCDHIESFKFIVAALNLLS